MTTVPAIRRLWALIHADVAGVSQLEVIATDPTPAQVEAAAGVLLLEGMLKGDCARMALPIVAALPRMPRFGQFTGTTATDGVATIVFDPPFPAVPTAIVQATPKVLVNSIGAEIVAGTLTAAGCKVKVTTQAAVTGAVTALAGAAVTVTALGA